MIAIMLAFEGIESALIPHVLSAQGPQIEWPSGLKGSVICTWMTECTYPPIFQSL